MEAGDRKSDRLFPLISTAFYDPMTDAPFRPHGEGGAMSA
jgi:hypothetical protein